jgi:hypothetical protein
MCTFVIELQVLTRNSGINGPCVAEVYETVGELSAGKSEKEVIICPGFHLQKLRKTMKKM